MKQMRKLYELIDQVPPTERWLGLLSIPIFFGLMLLWLEIVERWQIIGIICIFLMIVNTGIYLTVVIINKILDFINKKVGGDDHAN